MLPLFARVSRQRRRVFMLVSQGLLNTIQLPHVIQLVLGTVGTAPMVG